MPKFTLEIVNCPECTAPAEVADRFVLESTDGPIKRTPSCSASYGTASRCL
jgi:hypothetical protein